MKTSEVSCETKFGLLVFLGHPIVHVPWVRLDEVKAVVNDDPADLVILGLSALVLVEAKLI